MGRFAIRRPAAGTVFGLTALVLSAGGLAMASIPSSDGTIHACYDNQDGALRVIDPGAAIGGTCSAGQTPLAWNQTGPQGPPGVPGTPGAAGAAGAGTNAYEATFDGHACGPFGCGYYGLPPNGSPITVSLPLPAGTYALFGKANLGSDFSGYLPGGPRTPDTWVDSIPVICDTLVGVAGQGDRTEVSVGPGGQRRTTASDELIHTFTTAGTATFSCYTSTLDPAWNSWFALPDNEKSPSVYNMALVAVKTSDVQTLTLNAADVSSRRLTLVKAKKKDLGNPLLSQIIGKSSGKGSGKGTKH
jgi:hypothetical protein